MRELKFRAYIKPLKRYANGMDTIQFHKCCDVAGAGIWTVVTVNDGIFEFDDIIVEQSIGFKDKKGKDIYYGDIIKLDGRAGRKRDTLIYEVIADDYYSSATTRTANDDEGSIFFNAGATEMYFKVIGNIHENPELMENEQ